jgi:hypothetical protein
MDNRKDLAEVAKRAADELAYAMAALQRAGALFRAIESATATGIGQDVAFLLAQAGAEAAGYQAERAESESDFFREVSHA